MTSLISFSIIAIIVGFVTAGLKIQFDRFFAVVLLIMLMNFSVERSINVFLWILFLSAGYALFKNREKIKGIPTQNKKKFLTLIPVLAFAGVYIGTTFFASTSNDVLLTTVGVIALLYGLRLIFIHFKPEESEYKNEKPIYQKICGLFGPIVSGFFVGFVGTSLKPLKIPFAVKIGKLNLGQVYLGNTITAFYASFFAILLHGFSVVQKNMTLNNAVTGIGLWVSIHIVYMITDKFFKNSWRKPFQILIGILLVLVSFKFF